MVSNKFLGVAVAKFTAFTAATLVAFSLTACDSVFSKKQSGAKSVEYYKQNPDKAWEQLSMCEDMSFAEMDGDAQEKKRVADFYKTKDGKIFKQECDNASESVR